MPKTVHRSWRKPAFASGSVSAMDYGNAVHRTLQYIRYENCRGEASISQELERITQAGFLTPEQAQLVDISQLASFFSSEIGKKLTEGVPHLREFKFSVLDEGSHYGDGLAGEQVLLQGVVDCALLEADGMTVLDFKTDRVGEASLADRLSLYRPQVQTYAEALSRIYEMPVKAKYLYFFHLNRFVEL
jgi:ATP-dependent helicase/nuclease subunit A